MSFAQDPAELEIYELLMMEYAAGALDLAQSAVIAAHISLSPEGRDYWRRLEDIGGALMEKCCDPAALRAGSLDAVLARIEEPLAAPRAGKPGRRAVPEECRLPPCVEEILMIGPGIHLHWRTIRPGIAAMKLPVPAGAHRARIYRFDPGRDAPPHRPAGLEITLVLDGGFSDARGDYRTGALMISTPETPEHAPVSCPDEGCVCLSVISVPPRGPLARFFSSFLQK